MVAVNKAAINMGVWMSRRDSDFISFDLYPKVDLYMYT